MPEPTERDDGSTGAANRKGRDYAASGGKAFIGRIPWLGFWAWSFVGLVVATMIVATSLAAVSEIMLPPTFAAVLAVIFKPLAAVLTRHKVKPSIAAGLLVLGLLALATGVVVATVRGVTAQADQIGVTFDAALNKATHCASTGAHWRQPGRRPRTRPQRSPVAS